MVPGFEHCLQRCYSWVGSGRGGFGPHIQDLLVTSTPAPARANAAEWVTAHILWSPPPREICSQFQTSTSPSPGRCGHLGSKMLFKMCAIIHRMVCRFTSIQNTVRIPMGTAVGIGVKISILRTHTGTYEHVRTAEFAMLIENGIQI